MGAADKEESVSHCIGLVDSLEWFKITIVLLLKEIKLHILRKSIKLNYETTPIPLRFFSSTTSPAGDWLRSHRGSLLKDRFAQQEDDQVT